MFICEPCNVVVTDKMLNKEFPIRSKIYALNDLVCCSGVNINNVDLDLIVSYLEYITQNYFNHNLNELPDFVLKEADYFEKNKIFSVYLIIILFNFFKYYDISMKDLKFYNGYVYYKKFSDYYFAEGKHTLIPHPFITYKGAIIDCAIYSEYVMLPIEFNGFVFGQAPKYIQYYGVEEELSVIYNHCLDFLKKTCTVKVDIEGEINIRFNNHKDYILHLIGKKILNNSI
jgi:hypothetical protein